MERKPEEKVRIVRAEHWKRTVSGERAEKLGVFRGRVGEALVEEAVLVAVVQPASKYDAKRLVYIPFSYRFTKDHLHVDVQKWKDLLDRKKASGLSVTVADAVLAYLLVWGWGRKSVISAFLWAMGDEYPELRTVHREVRTSVKVTPLFGEERVEERITREARPAVNAEELVDTVGQMLSRMARKGVIKGG